MITQILECTYRAIRRQNYESAYLPQAIPILGPIVSIPTALISGTMMIVNVAQLIFQKFQRNPSFQSQNEKKYEVHRNDALDLSIIFTNNVINICTLGILNNCFVNYVLSNINCG
ncbi:MAG: hypothetical protein P4L16_03395 [Chlamydiales bacterium]|nr:hypothetical protein [Chlamydiales bacterium]